MFAHATARRPVDLDPSKVGLGALTDEVVVKAVARAEVDLVGRPPAELGVCTRPGAVDDCREACWAPKRVSPAGQ